MLGARLLAGQHALDKAVRANGYCSSDHTNQAVEKDCQQNTQAWNVMNTIEKTVER